MNLINMISDYFSYSFVWYAFIAGILAALCSSLLGVTLVLKRYSFIGDGLSHVAFGAMAVAAVLSVSNNLLIVMPVTIISAILLLKTGQNAKIKGDAALAMISVGSMAFGYLLLNLFSASANISGDVCSTLFGSTSILTLTGSDIILCVSMSIAVILIFVLFYNRIFAVTFAFFTNKKYVFKSKTHTKSAFWKECSMFYGARLVTYFLELAIMELGNHFFATVNGEIVTWRTVLVKIAAQIVILVINYIFSKLVIFKKREEPVPQK